MRVGVGMGFAGMGFARMGDGNLKLDGQRKPP